MPAVNMINTADIRSLETSTKIIIVLLLLLLLVLTFFELYYFLDY